MASLPRSVLDAMTRHQIYIGRYSTAVANRLIAILNRADGDLVAEIIKALDQMPASSVSVARLDGLLKSVRDRLADVYSDINSGLRQDIRQFCGNEAAFGAKIMQQTAQSAAVDVQFAAVSADQVYAAAMARPFQGSLLREALAGVEASTAKRVRDAIRMGFVEGRTTSQIVTAIRGTKAAGYADGLLNRSRQDIDALVRTAVNHTSNVARQVMYEENDDILGGWMFVATLDNRTSITCASLNGKTFPVGKGPQPPRHWNCRSSTVPMLAGQTKLFGTRSSADGYVDANLSFTDWLRGQPEDVQNDILGKTRADLFREKKIQVDRFTDARGNVLTLDELRKKDAGLFD